MRKHALAILVLLACAMAIQVSSTSASSLPDDKLEKGASRLSVIEHTPCPDVCNGRGGLDVMGELSDIPESQLADIVNKCPTAQAAVPQVTPAPVPQVVDPKSPQPAPPPVYYAPPKPAYIPSPAPVVERCGPPSPITSPIPGDKYLLVWGQVELRPRLVVCEYLGSCPSVIALPRSTERRRPSSRSWATS